MREYTQTVVPILYTWEFINDKSVNFTIHPRYNHSMIDIKDAKEWIKQNRGVKFVKTVRKDKDFEYHCEIYKHDKVKHLRWYQINDDEKLIHEARVKGLTPEQYVDKYVLPNINATHKLNLQKYGESIYGV